MKKGLLAIIALCLFTISSFAQDTIVVQTLDFDDITKRRGWYDFPEATQYQKILMYYTLKCDAATTQDAYACGEWDYTTYTNLYQHNNVGTDRYFVNGGYPDTINYVNEETYTTYQNSQNYIVYDNTISETDYSIGTGTEDINHTFKTSSQNGNAQYLWKADELTTAGISAGSIDKLKLDFSSLGGDLNNLVIKMKHSSFDELTSSDYEVDGFQTVYELNTSITATGVNSLNLSSPFDWNGTSNVAIEFCFDNQESAADFAVKGSTTTFGSGSFITKDDGFLDFEWGDYVQVPGDAFTDISDEITVSFWSKGDMDELPANTYAFEGLDADGQRVINVHLPWSNSRIYWDAGNSGSNSYDRIDQAASLSNFAGSWSHWAFTKNITSGEMKIYLNGNLWHSGTGKTRTMGGITNFRIAARGAGAGAYDGGINEFRVWNKELDESTIQEWMNKDVDASHPDYANLKAYFTFDENDGFFAEDESGNDQTSSLIGLPARDKISGCDLYRNRAVLSERPNLIFTQGEYESHLETLISSTTVPNAPVSIIQYTTSVDPENPGIVQLPVDTIFAWEAGYQYTFDVDNVAIDSVFIDNDAQLVNDYKQVTFQIQNYVTPYGIGLSLGPQGFRWVYDVTDYGPLLHDLVEISAGNQQELIDLKFVMITGTPPRDVLDIQSLYVGDYQHSDVANDVALPAVDIDLLPEASSFRVKTRTSGHWFGGFQNCAEFCPKLHHLNVDGVMQFQWNNWKECADNPVIAQGGTWIYDRAGWCPGTFTDTYDHEITPFVTPGETVSLDYGMIVTPAGMEGNYRISMQLVSYGENNFNVDAALSEIVTPNDWEFWSKINPICTDPIIVIENTGTTELTSLQISYNVLGGTAETYTWTGNLSFLEKEKITLPISSQSFWNTSEIDNVFEVNLSQPNGVADEYADNNYASASFEKPEVYGGLFMFRTVTNNAGYENSYTIKDDQGNVVMSRDDMSNNTNYQDTVYLPDGCYVLDFIDSGQDGLSFFANSDGTGSVRFKGISPSFTNLFNPKFGSYIKHHFIIDNTVGIDENNQLHNIAIYPNPSADIFNIRANGIDNGEVRIVVVNTIGQVVISDKIEVRNGELITSFNLENEPNGMYVVRLYSNNGYMIQSVVKE